MDEKLLERIKRIEYRSITILMAVVPIVQTILDNTVITFGVGVGGVLELLSFHIFRRLLEKILDGTRRDKAKLIGAALALKLIIVGVGIALSTWLLPISVFAMLFGASLIVVSILIELFIPEKDNRH